MASLRPQNASIPVFPFRPSSVNGGYGSNGVRFFPDRRDDLPKENRSTGNEGNRTKRVVAMVTIALLVVAAVVVVAVVLGLKYTHQDQHSEPVNATATFTSIMITTTKTNATSTSNKITTTMAAAITTAATPPLNLTMVQLIGNFTILNQDLQSVSASDVCQKITYAITKGGQNVSNCQITDLRSGSVKVRFGIDVEKEAKEDGSKALNRASTSLALALTNDTIYFVDPNSITFDDRNNGSGVESNCGGQMSHPCSGENIVCISVVDGYVCVCAAGFQRDTAGNGPCTPQDAGTSPSANSIQKTYTQSTTSNSQSSRPLVQSSSTELQTKRNDPLTSGPVPQTSRPDFKTSGPGLQASTPNSIPSGHDISTMRPDFITSGPGLQTLRPDSKTSGPGIKASTPNSIPSGHDIPTRRPDFVTSGPGPQTTRPITQSTRSNLQTSVSDVNTSSVSAMTSSQSAMITTTACSVFCVPTQTCIPSHQICDKTQDCPDDSDEINCVCDRNHYGCTNGRCIYKTWLCDGVTDCPMGDDESPPQCKPCNSSEFVCAKPRSCVPRSAHCDGVIDCSDSSDESSCLKINETSSDGNVTVMSLVSVIYRGDSGFYICSDDWNETWSNAVCKQMGHVMSSSTSYQHVGLNESFLVLNTSVSASNLLAYLQISNCTSNLAVAVSCIQSVCGRRSVSSDMIGPYILNGALAKRGAWPWQVLHYVGIYSGDGSFSILATCGGILINDRWILTAGHCNTVNFGGLGYTGQLRPANVLIRLGSLSRDGDADSRNARVDAVFVHPSFTSSPTVDNDVGLLRLSESVTFTDTIRPICLPSSSEDLSKFRVCVDTGYGRNLRNEPSRYLLQARMNLLSYADCYNYFKNSFLRDQTQICVGTIPTEADINFCQGDSGGPLSCQGPDGLWKVIGINSYVLGTNDGTAISTCYLSVVTRVTQFVDWIKQTMSANSV